MTESTYQDLRSVVIAYLDAPPDTDLLLTDLTQRLAKRLRHNGADSTANHFMVEFAAFIDRTREETK